MDEDTRKGLIREMTRRFPDDALTDVQVLGYGDDPAVEPGSVGIRVTINAERYPSETDHPLDRFVRTHHEVLDQARLDMAALPGGAWIEFRSSAGDQRRMTMRQGSGPEAIRRLAQPRPSVSTPVTARLDAEQLETLDTLITAGIAANRAEAVRWAVDRIRERPAYARLRERAREIDELKDQF